MALSCLKPAISPDKTELAMEDLKMSAEKMVLPTEREKFESTLLTADSPFKQSTEDQNDYSPTDLPQDIKSSPIFLGH
jgi:hypothetical protein